MFLVSFVSFFVWHSQFCGVYEVSSNTITCDLPSDPACNGQELTCDPGEECIVECTANLACQNSVINCADDYPCSIFFEADQTGLFAEINGNSATALTLETNGASSGASATINCPANPGLPGLITCKISVNANDGCDACRVRAETDDHHNVYVFLSANMNADRAMVEAFVNAVGADSVRLYSVAPDAFKSALVFCPVDGPVTKQCVIDMPSTDATESLLFASVYAVQGLNDFGVDGFIPNELDTGIFTLLCGEEYDESCQATYDAMIGDIVCLTEGGDPDLNHPCSAGASATESPSEEPTEEPQLMVRH